MFCFGDSFSLTEESMLLDSFVTFSFFFFFLTNAKEIKVRCTLPSMGGTYRSLVGAVHELLSIGYTVT